MTTPPQPPRELRPMPDHPKFFEGMTPFDNAKAWHQHEYERADALEDRLRLAVELLAEAEERMNRRSSDPEWWNEYDRLLASLPESMR